MDSRGAGFHGIHVAFLSMPACVTVSTSFRGECLVDGLPAAFRLEFDACTRRASDTQVGKSIVRSRSGIMGRIFSRIFSFSDFSRFRSDFGLMSSGIVLDTSAVFTNAGLIVLDLHSGLMFVNVGRIVGPDLFVDFRIFGFISLFCLEFGLVSPFVVPCTRSVFSNAGRTVQDLHHGSILIILVVFAGRNFAAFSVFCFCVQFLVFRFD